MTGFDATGVTAELPAGTPDGDYRLTVSTGPDYAQFASFDLTVADLEERDPTIGTLQAGKWCDSDGTQINCTEDAPAGGITAVTAGSGLSGGGNSGEVTLSVDTGTTQARVSGSCASGSAIRTIDAGGGVSCQSAGIQSEVDGDTTNELNTGFSLSGTTLSVTDAGGSVSRDIGLLQGDFVVKRLDGTEGFRMTTGGNFGIGDYWYNVGLNVKSAEDTIFQVEDASGTDLLEVAQDGTVGIGATPASNVGLNVGSANTYIFQAADSAGEALFQVYQGGAVGIGETHTNVGLNVRSAEDTVLQIEDATGADLFEINQGGNVGIGAISTSVALRVQSSEGQVFLAEDETGKNLLSVYQSGRVTINGATSYANVGVNIESDLGQPLIVQNSSNENLFQLQSDGDLFIRGSYGQLSDARLKDAIADLDYGVAEVLAMQPRAYVMKDDPQTPEIGLIAQELQPIVPEAVTPGSEAPAAPGEQQASSYWSVSYSKLVPVLIGAIQDQQAIIDAQQAAIDALAARLDAAGL